MLGGTIIFEMEKKRLKREILNSLKKGKIRRAIALKKYLYEYEKRMMKALPYLC